MERPIESLASRSVADRIVGEFLNWLDEQRHWVYRIHEGPISEKDLSELRSSFLERFAADDGESGGEIETAEDD